METFTGNEDVDLYIMLMMIDEDIEILCETNVYMHYLCRKLWLNKIKLLYPNFPILKLTYIEYKALYYKLKYNQWSDIVVYAELNNNLLLQWLIENNNYEKYVINTVIKYLKSIGTTQAMTIQISSAINLFKFIYTHRQLFNKNKWAKLKNIIKLKLIELRDTIPEIHDVLDLYLQFLY
jgi:hypothetical protein